MKTTLSLFLPYVIIKNALAYSLSTNNATSIVMFQVMVFFPSLDFSLFLGLQLLAFARGYVFHFLG